MRDEPSSGHCETGPVLFIPSMSARGMSLTGFRFILTVKRKTEAGMIRVEKADPCAPESQRLINALSAELAAITGDDGRRHFAMAAMDEKRALWVVARNHQGVAVGCGAIRPLTETVAELKRMYSDRSEAGIGRALLTFLEESALGRGYTEIWLETRAVNHKAVRFYQNSGYNRIANYGPYINREEAVCFAKVLS